MKPIPNLVSILIPLRNAEHTLTHTLESIKAQTLRDYEVILIDDASTDQTLNLINAVSHRDARFHVIALPTERGIPVARSIGLDAARGQYVAFLNPEETWDTTKLFKQREAMKVENAGLTCTAYRTTKGRIHQIPHRITLSDLVLDNPIRLSTVMIDRHVVGDLRLVPDDDQELILWNTLLQQAIPVIGLPEVLVTCVHPAASTPLQSLKRRWYIATSICHLSLLEALKLMMHPKHPAR